MHDNAPLIKEIDARMAKLAGDSMREARLQGIHFRYAVGKGEVIIETSYQRRFFYWLLCEKGFVLIDASDKRKVGYTDRIGGNVLPKILDLQS